MKLYEIPRESKIRLPIGREGNKKSKLEVCDFHHIDGMYSYITVPGGGAVHLGASTEVKLGKDGIYKLV
jgi:hypothetical protein